MTTVQDFLTKYSDKLKSAGIESHRLDLLILLEKILQRDRSWVLAHPEFVLPSEILSKLERLVLLRLNHEPLAYITNEAWFYGRNFYVDNNVLIPRPESEDIISLLLGLHYANPIILDLGTGSGCLAITAYLELNQPRVIATDVSQQALEVARKNCYQYQAHIELRETFLLDDLLNEPIDIIMANLPYVPDGLVTSQEIEHEPEIALFSGVNGLDLYQSFWAQLHQIKSPPKYVLSESLENQHSKMTGLAATANYSLIRTSGLIQLWQHIVTTG